MLAVLNRVGFIAPDPLRHGRCHEQAAFASAGRRASGLSRQKVTDLSTTLCVWRKATMRRRTWRTLLLIGAVASVPASHLQAGPGTWTGWITDVHCDVNVPKAEHVACVAKGLNEGIARLHVYDAKTRRRYLLNDQKRATPYAGRFVTVAGDMQEAVGRHPQDLDGVIAIAAIAPRRTNELATSRRRRPRHRRPKPEVAAAAARTGGGGLTARERDGGLSGAGASRGRPTNAGRARRRMRRWIPRWPRRLVSRSGCRNDRGNRRRASGNLPVRTDR